MEKESSSATSSDTTVDASVTIKIEKPVEIEIEETDVVKAEEVEQKRIQEDVDKKVEENVDETESETEEESEEIVIEEVTEESEKTDETKQKPERSEVIARTPPLIKSEVKLEDVKDEPDEVAPLTSSENDENRSVEEKEEKKEDVSDTSDTSKDIRKEVNEEDGGEEIEVSAETTTASEVDSVDNSPKTEELRKPDPEAKTVAADTIVNESAKHENINNTLREIISDIDTNIKEDEAILLLKKEEQNLLKKHEELTKCIEEQQQLAKKLAAENQIKLEELNKQQAMQQLIQQNQQEQRKETTLPDIYTNTSVRTENTYIQSKDASYSAPINQSSNEPKDFSYGPNKQIDLNKIFTPATDNVELCQKNRKLYASSAFYSPSLHPTVEDQVELARRISHSLSDISNQTSKGQSMYDNRKKRSVKWVHESIGQGTTEENDFNDNAESQTRSNIEKIPLRLVMNPRGHVIDFNSVQESVNTKTGLLSPDRCAELVYALQTQKGKGAELFAKRRKKSDKWIIDETNAGTQSPSGIPDHNQVPANKSPVSPSILPAYSEAGKHRVQLNMHQQQVLEKYGQPSLTVVKTPWEAALETGSASTAFVEDHTYNSLSKPLTPLPQSFSPQPTSTNFTQSNIRNNEQNSYLSKITATREGPAISNPQRDLAYKPSVAQGWNAPTVTLPKHMFVPKEIPLENYAPPPVAPGIQTRPVFGGTGSNFPASVKQQPDNFPRNTQWQPTYIQNTSPVPIAQKPAPQVNFNPSPLSHEKLSKFENKIEQTNYGALLSDYNPNSARTYNTSPAPFGGPSITPNSVQNNWNPNKNIEIRKSVGQPPNRIYNNNNKTFNNLARGWGCGNNYGCSSPIKQHTSNFAPKMGGTTALPYTDF